MYMSLLPDNYFSLYLIFRGVRAQLFLTYEVDLASEVDSKSCGKIPRNFLSSFSNNCRYDTSCAVQLVYVRTNKIRNPQKQSIILTDTRECISYVYGILDNSSLLSKACSCVTIRHSRRREIPRQAQPASGLLIKTDIAVDNESPMPVQEIFQLVAVPLSLLGSQVTRSFIIIIEIKLACFRTVPTIQSPSLPESFSHPPPTLVRVNQFASDSSTHSAHTPREVKNTD